MVDGIIQLHDKQFKPLINRKKIEQVIKKIAHQIQSDYNDKNPVFVIVLKGSVMFATDLIREITLPCTIEFLKAESYGAGLQSSGEVKINALTTLNLRAKDVIIIEDIIDTGLTLKKILRHLAELQPASIRIATLLLKPEINQGTVIPDYVGFEISPLFVVGYGLDYDELGRNLPDIYVLTD